MKNQNDLYIESYLTDNAKADVWYLHGLTETNSYFDLLKYDSRETLNQYFIDLPGFARSPLPPVLDLEIVATQIVEIILDKIQTNTIILLGHSIGGSIATKIFSLLPDMNKFFINIDGLLIHEYMGSSSLSKVVKFNNAMSFKEYLVDHWQVQRNKHHMLERFYMNILHTDPHVLFKWANAIIAFLEHDKILALYKKNSHNTLYIYGELSINQRNIDKVIEYNLPSVKLSHTGHWPMLEQPEQFTNIVYNCIRNYLSGMPPQHHVT